MTEIEAKDKIHLHEIFSSIQGEGFMSGTPMTFIRLWGCNLSCAFCDTPQTAGDCHETTVAAVSAAAYALGNEWVCITGGEPLLQKNVSKLINLLKKENYKIFIETNGSMDMNLLPRYGVIRIMDVKCPDSGMNREMDWKNLERLRGDDEVKFVMSSRKDYEWAKRIVKKHNLPDRTKVLFGSAYGKLKPKSLAEWILKDKLNVRLQLQLHRIIWPDKTRGV